MKANSKVRGRKPLTQDLLRKHLEYRDGHLYWIRPRAKCVKVGQKFGCINKDGYVSGRLYSKTYDEHKLVWLYFTGEWVTMIVDHKNGIRNDNRIGNLRLVTRQQNRFNSKANAGTKSKYKGVTWYSNMKKWRARLTHNGKPIHLGYYECEVEAAKAYDNYADKVHKEFTRKNL